MSLSQIEIITRLQSFFAGAKIYQKYAEVIIRPAILGEQIGTVTSDGAETMNRAAAGDFILTNDTRAKEQYIISAEKLRKRYEPTGKRVGGGEIYKATGKCRAIKVNRQILKALGVDSVFEFIAPWGSKMVCKKGDMLASPDLFGPLNEVYRIALKEFNETYR